MKKEKKDWVSEAWEASKKLESEDTCKSTAEGKYLEILHYQGKWYQKKWYFCKFGGGCGNDVHTWYRIVDEFIYRLGLEPSTKGVIWGVRIF